MALTTARETRSSRRIQLASLALILAIGVGALLANTSLVFNRGTKSDIAHNPPPTLFADARLGQADQLVWPMKARAAHLVDAWLRTHPGASDAAFSAFALASIPRPPAATAQRPELSALHRIATARSPSGDAAAAWLEQVGAKKIWKLYAKEYSLQTAPAQGKRGKAAVKASLKLAKQLVASALPRFQRVAPYEADRSLSDPGASKDQPGRLKALAATGAKRFSYPSKHAAASAAAVAVLDALEPKRGAEFRWMADEIAYSWLYAGGHFPSDVRAGALLGFMIGRYELRSAGLAA